MTNFISQEALKPVARPIDFYSPIVTHQKMSPLYSLSHTLGQFVPALKHLHQSYQSQRHKIDRQAAQSDSLKLSLEQAQDHLNSSDFAHQGPVYQATFNKIYGINKAKSLFKDIEALYHAHEDKENLDINQFISEHLTPHLDNGNQSYLSGFLSVVGHQKQALEASHQKFIKEKFEEKSFDELTLYLHDQLLSGLNSGQSVDNLYKLTRSVYDLGKKNFNFTPAMMDDIVLEVSERLADTEAASKDLVKALLFNKRPDGTPSIGMKKRYDNKARYIVNKASLSAKRQEDRILRGLSLSLNEKAELGTLTQQDLSTYRDLAIQGKVSLPAYKKVFNKYKDHFLHQSTLDSYRSLLRQGKLSSYDVDDRLAHEALSLEVKDLQGQGYSDDDLFLHEFKLYKDNAVIHEDWSRLLTTSPKILTVAELVKEDVPEQVVQSIELYDRLSSLSGRFTSDHIKDPRSRAFYEQVKTYRNIMNMGLKEAVLKTVSHLEKPDYMKSSLSIPTPLIDQAVKDISNDGLWQVGREAANKGDIKRLLREHAQRHMSLGLDEKTSVENASQDLKRNYRVINNWLVHTGSGKVIPDNFEEKSTIAVEFLCKLYDLDPDQHTLLPDIHNNNKWSLVDKHSFSAAKVKGDYFISLSLSDIEKGYSELSRLKANMNVAKAQKQGLKEDLLSKKQASYNAQVLSAYTYTIDHLMEQNKEQVRDLYSSSPLDLTQIVNQEADLILPDGKQMEDIKNALREIEAFSHLP